MPNLFKFGPFLIYFWSNEGTEPVHVHVSIKRPSQSSAKFWILTDGHVQLANNHSNISKKDLNHLARFIEFNADFIVDTWKRYFTLTEVKFYK